MTDRRSGRIARWVAENSSPLAALGFVLTLWTMWAVEGFELAVICGITLLILVVIGDG